MSKKMKCPQCGDYVWDEQKFCDECGEQLDWSNYVPEPETPYPKGVHHGSINCSCGQIFWIETINGVTDCINCGKTHVVTHLPVKGDENGTDI